MIFNPDIFTLISSSINGPHFTLCLVSNFLPPFIKGYQIHFSTMIRLYTIPYFEIKKYLENDRQVFVNNIVIVYWSVKGQLSSYVQKFHDLFLVSFLQNGFCGRSKIYVLKEYSTRSQNPKFESWLFLLIYT